MKNKKCEFYIGMDVHKRFTAYAVRNKEGDLVLEGSCATNCKDIFEVLEPYLFSCMAGLESNTEVYPIYDGFKDKSLDVRVANTIQLRTLVGKNDPLDAKRLSDMLRLGTFPCSYIPEEKIRSLRNVVKVRHNMREACTKIQVQIRALIRMHGLSMPPGDSFTKRWCASLEGHIALQKGGLELRYLYDMYTFEHAKLEQVTNEMIHLVRSSFPKEFEALGNRQGIGDVLASYFISQICPINRFKSEKSLRRYAGVIPCKEESAGKTYSTCLPKTTSRGILRWAFVEAAHCMSLCDDKIKAYYRKKKKEKKISGTAMMAVARCACDIVYKILTSIQVHHV